jgi:hypothetical protein
MPCLWTPLKDKLTTIFTAETKRGHGVLEPWIIGVMEKANTPALHYSRPPSLCAICLVKPESI